jgi:predicted ATP-grasp superfamily ATP-dependent carboligase
MLWLCGSCVVKTEKFIHSETNIYDTNDYSLIMNVLLTDANARSTLVTCRALGRKGVKVSVLSDRLNAVTFCSKYCGAKLVFPRIYKNVSTFLNCMQEILASNSYTAIYPMTDLAVLLAAHHRDTLSKFTEVPVPSFEKVESVQNKAITLKLAEKLGIPYPTTYFAEDYRSLKNIAQELTFPAVIKPRVHFEIVNNMIKYMRGFAQYVFTYNDLVNVYSRMQRISPNPIIQEYVYGDGYAASFLFKHGALKAVFVHKRLREYHPTGGPSVYRMSVAEPQAVEYAAKLLKELKWHGVAMVEFKRDLKDGTFKLLEINGRFWGSLQLAIASGVNFPYLLYRMIVEGDIQPVTNYKTGVKCRDLWGDFKHFIRVLVEKPPSSLKYPRKSQTFIDFFKTFTDLNVNYDYLAFDDFKPFLSNIYLQLTAMFEKFKSARAHKWWEPTFSYSQASKR